MNGNGKPLMNKLEKYRDLFLEKKAIIQLAIVRGNGRPHVSPLWFDLTEDEFNSHIINLNTATGRVKANNLKVGSPVSMVIMDPENPYRYSGFEGEIKEMIMGEVAETHIDKLAKKYLNQDVYPNRTDKEKRIKLVIKIAKVHGR